MGLLLTLIYLSTCRSFVPVPNELFRDNGHRLGSLTLCPDQSKPSDYTTVAPLYTSKTLSPSLYSKKPKNLLLISPFRVLFYRFIFHPVTTVKKD